MDNRRTTAGGWPAHSLVYSQAVLIGLLLPGPVVGQPLSDPSEDSIRKAYVVDYELIKAGDAGTRIGIAFLHKLYQQQPDLPPEDGARLGSALVQAWNKSYGPERNTDARARLRDLKALAKDLAKSAATRKVTPDVIERGLTIGLSEFLRRDDELSRRFTLIYGAQALKQSPQSWGERYALIQQPEALVDAVEYARGHSKASGAMSELLRQTGRVQATLDDPMPEWERRHPDAARGLKLFELKEGQAKLAANQEELKRRLKELAKRTGRPARTVVERIVAERERPSSARTPAEREAELKAEFAPYFAAHNVLMSLVKNDKDLRPLGEMIGVGLEMGYLTAGLSSGVLTGWGAVFALGAAFVNAFHVLDEAKPTDTQLILGAIQDVRKDIRDLQDYVAKEFAGLRMQLFDTLVVIDARFDQLERAVAYAHRDLRDLLVNNAYTVALLRRTVDANQLDLESAVSDLGDRDLKPLRLQREWKTISQEKLNETLDKLRATAIESSRDRLATGPPLDVGPEATADSDQLYQALAGNRLSPKIDHWGRLAAVQDAAPRYGRALSVKRLPNPKLWAVCAEDYLALARAWGTQYREYDPDLSKLGTLLNTGQEVRDGTRRVVATIEGNPDASFLLAVTAALRGRVGRIDESIQTSFAEATKQRLAGYDPFRTAPKQVSAPPFVVNAFAEKREIPLADRFSPTLPKVKSVKRGGGPDHFVSGGYDPNDKNNVVDPTAKLEVKAIALDDNDQKLIEGLVPAEAKWAEAMGLGYVKVVVEKAGVGDEIINRGGKMVYPQRGELPQVIKERFPTYSKGGLTFDVRYIRLMLQVRAVFVPKGSTGTPFTLFAFRGESPHYYWFSPFKAGTQWWDSDKPDLRMMTLQQAYDGHLAQMVRDVLSGKDPVEQKEVEGGRADLDRLLSTHVSTQLNGMRENVVASYTAPAGVLDDRLDQVTAVRQLVHRYLCLGMGDWLTTSEPGKRITTIARELPDGSTVAVAVRKSPDVYLNPDTHKAAVGLLLSPCDRLDKEIKDLLDKSADSKSQISPLPKFYHALVDKTMAHLEEFFWESSLTRESVAIPVALRGTGKTPETP